MSGVLQLTGVWDTVQFSFSKAGVLSPKFKEECIFEDSSCKKKNHSQSAMINKEISEIEEEKNDNNSEPQISVPSSPHQELISFGSNSISTTITQTQVSLNETKILSKLDTRLDQKLEILEESFLSRITEFFPKKKNSSRISTQNFNRR